MSMAWETTSNDVLIVMEQNGIQVDVDMEEWKVDEIVAKLDHDAVEKAALYGDEMEQQTEYAYKEITRQLKEMGEILNEDDGGYNE